MKVVRDEKIVTYKSVSIITSQPINKSLANLNAIIKQIVVSNLDLRP